jgi:4-amino-4-deoxy-L-arabinose transferase-like glycosyltransferase
MLTRFSKYRRFYRYGIIALVALFFLLCLPLLSKVSRWRGDERFYTDAVIGMLQNGNYLIPTYSDGALRFKKPILTYWVVLASYKTLGVNYLASRLPFLLAGTAVVGLTYAFALALIRRRSVALVAAAIMASNLTVLYLSIRSTPDMLLTLFILMSMLGFTRLIFRGHRSAWDYGLAYLGIALAVATKGLLGLLPILFVIGIVLVTKPLRLRLKDLIHGPVLLATLPVALFWFVLAFTQHGDAAVSDFMGDQVGERFDGNKGYILSNIGVYLSSFVVQLLPWSAVALLVLIAAWRKRRSLFPEYRREMLFLGLWILLLFVVFIFGNIQRTRYFLPAYPHLAILTSLLLCTGFRDRITALNLKRLFLTLCWLIFGAGVVMTLAGVRIHLHLLVSGVIIAGLALFLITRTSRWAPAFFMAGFAVLIMTFSSIWDIGVRPLFFISAAPDITRQILLLEPAGTPVAMGGVSVIDESQIRVLSGGRVKPFKLSPTPSPEEISQVSLLVCNKRDFEQGKLGTGTVVGQASGFGGWRARDITALLSSKKKAAVWAARKQEYVLVRPHHSVAQ